MRLYIRMADFAFVVYTNLHEFYCPNQFVLFCQLFTKVPASIGLAAPVANLTRDDQTLLVVFDRPADLAKSRVSIPQITQGQPYTSC
jgi:hypothetical protein